MRWIIFLYRLTSSSFKLYANFDGMLLATFKVIVKKVGLLFSGHDLVILRNMFIIKERFTYLPAVSEAA